MADRNTKIRGTQIFDDTIPPSKMKALNNPVEGYILEYDSASQEFNWVPKLDSITETPSGDINGSNKNFTLTYTPESGSLAVFLNGLYQEEGSGKDYVVSGNQITFVNAPVTDDVIIVTYVTEESAGGGGADSYSETFDNGDLTASKITISHNLSVTYPDVVVYDNDDSVINPSDINYTDSNSVELDFTGMTPLTGTYKVRVIG